MIEYASQLHATKVLSKFCSANGGHIKYYSNALPEKRVVAVCRLPRDVTLSFTYRIDYVRGVGGRRLKAADSYMVSVRRPDSPFESSFVAHSPGCMYFSDDNILLCPVEEITRDGVYEFAVVSPDGSVTTQRMSFSIVRKPLQSPER